MDPFYVIAIDSTGTITPVRLDSRALELKLLQKLVGGHLEVVRPVPFGSALFDDVVILVDEDGIRKGKPVNVLASSLYNGFDPILGDVVLCCVDTCLVPDVYALPSGTAQALLQFMNTVRDGVLQRFGTLTADS